MMVRERFGRWGVVLGASEGLGRAWAHGLAAQGCDVVLVARRREPLEAVATELRARHGVDVLVHPCDLGTEDVWDRLAPALEGKELGVVVYNACFSKVGAFTDLSLQDKLTTLYVNARGPLVVSHHVAEQMAARGSGALVIMSSMSGFHGTAMVGTYAATKAFDTVLGEMLWEELGPRGVQVMVCAAGATRTPNFDAVTPETKRDGAFPMTPEAVVAEAIPALLAGKGPTFIPGTLNKVAATLFDLMPRRTATRLLSAQTRKMYEER